MSYNLLLDTNFNKIDKHWKLTNCYYRDGYLVSNSKVYSIEQEIALPEPTKLYFSMDYIAFDKNISKIYVGIQYGDTFQTIVKKPKFDKRVRASVVYPVPCESIKVKFIVEAKTEDTKLYIDSPMLVDLLSQKKEFWPRWMLNKALDYRYGYDYENLYKQCEISLDNDDFTSPYTETEKAKEGILAYVRESEWFKISFPMIQGHRYLVKLDLEEINHYGEVYLQVGEKTSWSLEDQGQIYVHFVADGQHEVRIKMRNDEQLDYIINFKRVLVIDITDKTFEEQDIPHLAFI